ncbi:hypothetical protein HETIRDRAFT_99006 [Heterobasidion irregulare TC 32-1]|uniref:Uncharacterized protein n=1 Tax=Heterobasidion irregulare (strain TC 32-1) TaxID=747525 RepID=W4KN87_HETIT|nr:uncharacterized protein HETIRDRAFT_99006 [Heterobasidion irregulare TC 32-1]ETW86521.1 hypothetical protein HETIRDRAFT_99006 [Heterobasidion irregulare TC 32-1]
MSCPRARARSLARYQRRLPTGLHPDITLWQAYECPLASIDNVPRNQPRAACPRPPTPAVLTALPDVFAHEPGPPTAPGSVTRTRSVFLLISESCPQPCGAALEREFLRSFPSAQTTMGLYFFRGAAPSHDCLLCHFLVLGPRSGFLIIPRGKLFNGHRDVRSDEVAGLAFGSGKAGSPDLDGRSPIHTSVKGVVCSNIPDVDQHPESSETPAPTPRSVLADPKRCLVTQDSGPSVMPCYLLNLRLWQYNRMLTRFEWQWGTKYASLEPDVEANRIYRGEAFAYRLLLLDKDLLPIERFDELHSSGGSSPPLAIPTERKFTYHSYAFDTLPTFVSSVKPHLIILDSAAKLFRQAIPGPRGVLTVVHSLWPISERNATTMFSPLEHIYRVWLEFEEPLGFANMSRTPLWTSALDTVGSRGSRLSALAVGVLAMTTTLLPRTATIASGASARLSIKRIADGYINM